MKVYLAGPINGCNDDEANGWRALDPRTWTVIDPMRRDYRGVEDAAADVIVEADLADIRECDAVIANCWKPSVGTSMEIFYAHSIGKPVVVVVPAGEPVSPWYRYHATVVHTVDDALDAVFSNTVNLAGA